MNPNRVTKRELARLLSCSQNDAYDVADRHGIPCDHRETVQSSTGEPFTYRVYLRAPVMAALDEIGRQAARRSAS